MATHSTILAWGIPWTEEPGRIQSTGSQESDTAEHEHTQQSVWSKSVHQRISQWVATTLLKAHIQIYTLHCRSQFQVSLKSWRCEEKLSPLAFPIAICLYSLASGKTKEMSQTNSRGTLGHVKCVQEVSMIIHCANVLTQLSLRIINKHLHPPKPTLGIRSLLGGLHHTI